MPDIKRCNTKLTTRGRKIHAEQDPTAEGTETHKWGNKNVEKPLEEKILGLQEELQLPLPSSHYFMQALSLYPFYN